MPLLKCCIRKSINAVINEERSKKDKREQQESEQQENEQKETEGEGRQLRRRLSDRLPPIDETNTASKVQARRSSGCSQLSDQKPYGQWFHPHKKLPDKVLSSVCKRTFKFEELTRNVRTLHEESRHFKPANILDEGDNDEEDEHHELRSSVTAEDVERRRRLQLQAQRTTSQLMIYQHRKHVMQPMMQTEYEKQLGRLVESKWRWTSASHVISRSSDILKHWGIVDYIDDEEQLEAGTSYSTRSRDTVKVVLMGPSSVLRPSKNSGGSWGIPKRIPDNLDPSTTPILLWFHGGGMMFGAAEDGYVLECAKSLVERQELNNASADILVISVDMSLAPERPFPHGIIDCLSAAGVVLETFPDSNNIHVAGVSSGANYATVVALECHRRYPGRIKSACILEPMLSPQADSESHRLNPKSSSLVPVNWLRWAWRLYLCLENTDIDGDDDEATQTTTMTLNRPLPEVSNRNALKKKYPNIPKKGGKNSERSSSPTSSTGRSSPASSTGRSSPAPSTGRSSPTCAASGRKSSVSPAPSDGSSSSLEPLKSSAAQADSTSSPAWYRLFSPQLDIPTGLGETSSGVQAPSFIVSTSLADPLHDDGVELVVALDEAGADVLHVESTGSHVIGRMFDKSASERLMNAWRTVLWD